MAVSLKHKFTSAKSDVGDTTLVRPSNWNDEHDLILATDKLLGRATAGTGAVEEITCTSAARDLLDDANAAAMRTTLGAAASGANTDITSVYLDQSGLKLKDSDASHGMVILCGSNLTADRNLTLLPGDGARTITIPASATISQDYSTTGNPQFATIELGAASDTTLSRASAGVLAVEGVTVPLNSITNTHTAQQIELGHASDTTITRVSAGVVAVEGATLAKVSDTVGQQTIWVPAGAMVARTTNGAAAGTFETTTNDVMLKYLAFDAATKEGAQFGIQMPKGWDEGTIIAQFVWTHPSTTTNFGVSWELAAVAFANDDASDTAFGTLQEIDDTGGTTYDIYISGETPAITVAGTPGAEEYVMFQVTRDPADAGDTMAVDAWLLGVKIHYTTNAAKDD